MSTGAIDARAEPHLAGQLLDQGEPQDSLVGKLKTLWIVLLQREALLGQPIEAIVETEGLFTQLWQVTDPQALRPPGAADPADVDAELVLFTHALDGTGTILGQEDRLDAPSWSWHVGDVIAQIHRFPLRADLSPGTVTLEVGAYRRGDLARLPVLVDGAIVGDRVLLVTVEVTGP